MCIRDSICPLSILERYERETRDRAWSWLCVIPRDSRNCRIRWPMFSTVSRFGQFSKSWRSSPGKSCGEGVGITNVTFGGRSRRQRRQLPVRVRYCTNPHTWQRITSRSISTELDTLTFFSDNDFLADYSDAAEGRNYTERKAENWRGRDSPIM